MVNGSERERARVFRALAVEKRLEIVALLAGRTLCVGALSRRLGISAGAVSQHLRILRDAGLVEPDRRGYFVHYRLAPGAHERCRTAMESLFKSNPVSAKGDGACAAEKGSARSRRT
jgi:DNA-binding transcriptional ArsR family regulator